MNHLGSFFGNAFMSKLSSLFPWKWVITGHIRQICLIRDLTTHSRERCTLWQTASYLRIGSIVNLCHSYVLGGVSVIFFNSFKNKDTHIWHYKKMSQVIFSRQQLVRETWTYKMKTQQYRLLFAWKATCHTVSAMHTTSSTKPTPGEG